MRCPSTTPRPSPLQPNLGNATAPGRGRLLLDHAAHTSSLILNGRFPPPPHVPYTCIRNMATGIARTITDYALLEARHLPLLSSCTVLQHSHLNLADHEAILTSLHLSPNSAPLPPPPRIPLPQRTQFRHTSLHLPATQAAFQSTIASHSPLVETYIHALHQQYHAKQISRFYELMSSSVWFVPMSLDDFC